MQACRLRDYLWLLTAQWLKEAEPVFAAEDRQHCEDLAGELASVRYSFNSQGTLVVEDKDSMRKRLGHSPDLADALCVTFGPGGNALPAVNLAPALGLDLRKASPLPPDQRHAWRQRFHDAPPAQSGDAMDRVARLWGVSNPYDDEYYT